MARDGKSKLTALTGASAVVFGSAFGVATAEGAKDKILESDGFKQKLHAIKEGVEKGEIKPFVVDGEKWIFNEKRNVEVAQWQQTWDKIDWKKQS